MSGIAHRLQSVHGFDRTLNLVATRREEDDMETELEKPTMCVPVFLCCFFRMAEDVVAK
jgi:hypothetical protein